MKQFYYITKKDAVVVLCCLVFVLANLGAIGSTGRRRAKEAICTATLKRLGHILLKHANDNNGYFLDRDGVSSWVNTVGPYLKSDRLLLCPDAVKTYQEGGRNPHMAWGPVDFDDYREDVVGSYVINNWLTNNNETKKYLNINTI